METRRLRMERLFDSFTASEREDFSKAVESAEDVEIWYDKEGRRGFALSGQVNGRERHFIDGILTRLLLAFPVEPVLHKKHIIPWMTRRWDDERHALAERLHLRRWTEVPSRYLKQEWAALCLLSRRGWIYFLPAYLRVIVTEGRESDMIPSVVVSTLCPATSFGRKRIGMLSLEQCKVLLSVVNYIKDIMPEENFSGEVDSIREYLLGNVQTAEVHSEPEPQRKSNGARLRDAREMNG